MLTPSIYPLESVKTLFFFQGRHSKTAARNDHYLAVAYAVRDRLFQRQSSVISSPARRFMPR